jgi:hypothetical protein
MSLYIISTFKRITFVDIQTWQWDAMGLNQFCPDWVNVVNNYPVMVYSLHFSDAKMKQQINAGARLPAGSGMPHDSINPLVPPVRIKRATAVNYAGYAVPA